MSGGTWIAALMATLQTGGGAMLLNEIMKRVFGIGKTA